MFASQPLAMLRHLFTFNSGDTMLISTKTLMVHGSLLASALAGTADASRAQTPNPTPTGAAVLVVSSARRDSGRTRPGFEMDELSQAHHLFTTNGFTVTIADHLWYLAYLWVYTLVLMALLPLLQSGVVGRLQAWLPTRLNAAALLLPSLAFFAYLMLLRPRFPETHALVGDWYLHAEYFTVFVLGYLVANDEGFWRAVLRLRWRTLAIALVAICTELLLKAAGQYLPAEQIPTLAAGIDWGMVERAALVLYLWSALLAIFGWGRALLDRPFRWLPYASEAVYPWYILHQSLIVVIAYRLIPLRLGAVSEPLLVVLGTVAGCLLLHELVIRRAALLRPLFGLTLRDRSPRWRVPGSG